MVESAKTFDQCAAELHAALEKDEMARATLPRMKAALERMKAM